MNMLSMKNVTPLLALSAALFAFASSASAQDFTNVEIAGAIDNLTMFLCAILVLFMQAGFALVEAGFNSSKNSINILAKNVMDLCVGVILYFIIGYNLMYPANWLIGEGSTAFLGEFAFGGLADTTGEISLDSGYLPVGQIDFLFQAVFAATAATIVSGAVAGRLQFKAYLIYSALLTALIYPIAGSWQWGGGWLAEAGFHDFAGSLIVHALGGFAALAGAIVLGPRLGRFNKDGSSNPIPGSNIIAATLGVFILIVGWFGFNPGSVLAMTGEVNTALVGIVAVNTLLAACTGGLLAIICSLFVVGKPDLGYALNGILAGLVGITANADVVTNNSALIIGGIAGILVVAGMVLLDKLRIDDTVGAWPVHGLCGIWGGLATAIFGTYEGKSLAVQAYGSIAYAAWAFILMFIIFSIMKAFNILRVSEDEEIEGLDLHEHGMISYPDFLTAE